jgi:hypothetical protein
MQNGLTLCSTQQTPRDNPNLKTKHCVCSYSDRIKASNLRVKENI